MVSVLDTSALLAALQDEPGQEQVDAALLGGECCMSRVNLAEFASKCLAGGLAERDLERVLTGFDLTIVAFDRAQALTTGKLRATTRHLGLSLGDRACRVRRMPGGRGSDLARQVRGGIGPDGELGYRRLGGD